MGGELVQYMICLSKGRILGVRNLTRDGGCERGVNGRS